MAEKTDSQRLKALEEMVQEIHALLVMGQVSTPGEEEYKRALAALEEGNNALLAAYIRRGGKPGKEAI